MAGKPRVGAGTLDPHTAFHHATAYRMLWQQEYAKNPKITLTQFKQMLHDNHNAFVTGAKAAHAAAQAAKKGA